MAESLPEKNNSNVNCEFNIECAVCLQTCVHPAELPCGHIFCFLCIKGISNQGRRCAMCRQTIPIQFFDKPTLLKPEKDLETKGFDDGHQWFYEGQNGWWQYDERTSQELETAYQKGERVCELLVAGYLYLIDFDSMLQLRRNDPGRRRRIKRDLATIPKKGIAGIKIQKQQPAEDRNKHSTLLGEGSRRRNEPDEEEESRDLSSVIDETLNWTIQQIQSLELDLLSDISSQSNALTQEISEYEDLQNALEFRREHSHPRLNRSFENELDSISSRLSQIRLNRSEENVSSNDHHVSESIPTMRLRSLSSAEFPDQLNSRIRDMVPNRSERRSRRSLPRSLSLRNRSTSPLPTCEILHQSKQDDNYHD